MKSSEEAKKPSQMDAYAPAEIAQLIENVGLAKVKLPFLPMFALAVLAGAFITFGHFSGLDIGGFVGNLIPVTLGNIIGGGVFVALTYKIIYLRDQN